PAGGSQNSRETHEAGFRGGRAPDEKTGLAPPDGERLLLCRRRQYGRDFLTCFHERTGSLQILIRRLGTKVRSQISGNPVWADISLLELHGLIVSQMHEQGMKDLRVA